MRKNVRNDLEVSDGFVGVFYFRAHKFFYLSANSLRFGSSFTWLGDSHPDSSVPCLARTLGLTGAPLPGRPR